MLPLLETHWLRTLADQVPALAGRQKGNWLLDGATLHACQ